MFILALALGMTVEELGDKMSARELAEWRVYYDLEPFGDCRADYNTGLLASMLANMFRDKGKKVAQPIDFMLHQDAQVDDTQTAERRQSQEKMIDALKGLKG